MGWLRNQFLALGTSKMPVSLQLRGKQYRLKQTFQHGCYSAVGLYRHGEKKVICKFHRSAPFFGVPMNWLGRLTAAYETTVLKKVRDLPGAAGLVGRPCPALVVREYVPGHPLYRHSKVNDDFFPRLRRLLIQLHRRGIAYVDLEKAPNVIVGEDGRPYLIDFQIAFYVPPRCLGETSLVQLVRGLLQKADTYHLLKHWRRIRPDQLNQKQIMRSREKPWPVRVGNFLAVPFKKSRRLVVKHLDKIFHRAKPQ